MTGKDGKVLPKCAAQIAVLEATGKQFSKSIGELHQDVKETKEMVQGQQITMATVTNSLDGLSKTVENLDKILDTRVNAIITTRQQECVVYTAIKKRNERDITQKFLVSSNPKDPIESSKEDTKILKIIKNIPKKFQKALYIGAIISGFITGVIAYLNF